MPPLRVLPPVHSPVTLAAIASGLGSLAGGADRARAAVTAALRERFGCRDLLLTDSGTGALTLALRAGRERAPGPVALPAYCCYDIATAADGADVDVLLYDLDPATLGPDFDSLSRVLARGARTIVVAHLHGVPVDLGAVRGLAERYDAFLVEDAAQGAGASYAGRPLGSLGSLGVLSFGRGKGVTSGRGGALLANDDAGTAALAAVRGQLQPTRTAPMEPIALVAQWLLARPSLYAVPASLPFLGLGKTVYRRPKQTHAMSAFALGVLRGTLALADTDAEARRANAVRLLARLTGARQAIAAIRIPAASVPGYLRLPVLARDTARHRLESGSARVLGVMQGYPASLSELPGFRARVMNASDAFPGAQRLVASLFTLPAYGRLSERDLRALEAWIGGPVA